MKTDILELYDNLKRDYENVKDRWTIKERIRDIESEREGQDSHERAYDQGWIDALKWVIQDKSSSGYRQEEGEEN